MKISWTGSISGEFKTFFDLSLRISSSCLGAKGKMRDFGPAQGTKSYVFRDSLNKSSEIPTVWNSRVNRHEWFTGKYTTHKMHTKPHPGLGWRIFHILTSKDIDDLPRKSSAIFGNFEKIFGNVRVTFGQVLKILRKSSESGRKSSERGKWSEIFGISSKRLSLINAVVKLIASRSDRLAEIYFCSK